MDENESDVYIATATAHIEYDGRRQVIRKGITRVRAGHQILEQYPRLFKPAGDDVRFDVEDATSRPSTKDEAGSRAKHRGRRVKGKQQAKAEILDKDSTNPAEPVKPYSEWTKADLRKEIEQRNRGREADKVIKSPSRASVDTLAELLAADDKTPVETGVIVDDDAPDVVVSEQSPTGIDPESKHSEGGEGEGDDGGGADS